MTDEAVAAIDALLAELTEHPRGCLVPGRDASDVHDTIYRLKKAYLRLYNNAEHWRLEAERLQGR